MRILFILLCTLVALILSSVPTYADSNCLPISNGGPTTQKVCFTPTVWPTPAPFTENIPNQTTSSNKVYSPSSAKTTPDTGPYDWSLPSLLLLGAAGLLLRKKSFIVKI